MKYVRIRTYFAIRVLATLLQESRLVHFIAPLLPCRVVQSRIAKYQNRDGVFLEPYLRER